MLTHAEKSATRHTAASAGGKTSAHVQLCWGVPNTQGGHARGKGPSRATTRWALDTPPSSYGPFSIQTTESVQLAMDTLQLLATWAVSSVSPAFPGVFSAGNPLRGPMAQESRRSTPTHQGSHSPRRDGSQQAVAFQAQGGEARTEAATSPRPWPTSGTWAPAPRPALHVTFSSVNHGGEEPLAELRNRPACIPWAGPQHQGPARWPHEGRSEGHHSTKNRWTKNRT